MERKPSSRIGYLKCLFNAGIRNEVHRGKSTLVLFSLRPIPVVLLLVALMFQVSSSHAEPTLLTTITNPAPETGTGFGYSVAMVGDDLLLVGEPSGNTNEITGAGVAYLFNSNGELIHTFLNPTPTYYEGFGSSVAAVGADRVLIGTPGENAGVPYAGETYLFSTNGTLLTTITNPSPTPNDNFGAAVAVLGNDRVLISAPGDSIGSPQAGAAYLFDTNGTLLTTITNPIPGPFLYDHFGSSVAVVGDDLLLIGAHQDEPDDETQDAGIAYLFDTNGMLLTTFTNETPERMDLFGCSLAGVGKDRVIIGAYQDDTGANDNGVAYLFSTNGTLLITITNPTPDVADHFGYAVATGRDGMLISAPYDRGAGSNFVFGAVYLFNTNGVLQETMENPTPEHADWFGNSIASSRSRALIGAYSDNTGVADAGAVYLFDFGTQVEEARMTIVVTNGNMVGISWNPDTPGLVLQESATLSSPAWTNSPSMFTNPIFVPATQPTMFYRLIKP